MTYRFFPAMLRLKPETMFAIPLMLCLGSAPSFAAAEPDDIDGLVPVENTRVAMAYVDPDADFSVFERVAILAPYVAFRSNWQRDQRRANNRVTAGDMERIQADVARLFLEVFTEVLEENGGYEVVDVANHDVLLLRPAIIDLDISAPDTMQAGRSTTFSATTGGATLYIELFDSLSGKKIGRAADRQEIRSTGNSVSLSNRVTNTAEARRMFRRWAQILRNKLDAAYPLKAAAGAADGE